MAKATLRCRPFVQDDPRPEQLLRAIERVFPGESLSWELLESGKSRRISDRRARLREAIRYLGEDDLIIWNGKDSDSLYISVRWNYTVAFKSFGRKVPDPWKGKSSVLVSIHFPNKTLSGEGEKLLASSGDALNAWHGKATPPAASSILLDQIIDDRLPGAKIPPECKIFPYGLPAVKGPAAWLHLPAPEIPGLLGWLNYWSVSTANVLEFPDPVRDMELLSRSWQTEQGAWLVKLTDSPLDFNKPDHIKAVLAAYERFDRIGVRY